jgi:hypothetical protein
MLSPAGMLGALVGLSVLASCSETVAFLSVDLEVAERTPALTCEGDPRRATRVQIRTTCEDGQMRETTLDLSRAAWSLGGVGLGRCRISARAQNRHGRAVLSGDILAELAAGDNPPQVVALVEEPCGPICDHDGDGVSTSDEQALGLDPFAPDTDGDGLSDQTELMYCCTDPLDPRNEQSKCGLLIESVTPSHGFAGQAVVVQMTEELSEAEVRLGGAVLDDTSIWYRSATGYVSPEAVLGDVTVEADGQRALHRELFAVTPEPPRLVVDLDRQAGAKERYLQHVVDLQTTRDYVLLLGTSTTRQQVVPRNLVRSLGANDAAGSEDPNTGGVDLGPSVGRFDWQAQNYYPSSTDSLLLVLDRETNAPVRATFTTSGAPVALAVSDAAETQASGTIADITAYALIRETDGQTALYVRSAGAPSQRLVVAASEGEPVSFVLERANSAGQVLMQDKLVRIRAPAGGDATAVDIALPSAAGVGLAGDARSSYVCTGLAYDRSSDMTYVACNYRSDCGVGDCPVRGSLLRFGPIADCVAEQAPRASEGAGNNQRKIDSSDGATLDATECWSVSETAGSTAVVGSPVIDREAERVYVLTTAGVFEAPRAALPAVLAPSVSFPWQGSRNHVHTMVRADDGLLYLVDGNWVRRVDPKQSSPEDRLGSRFSVGPGQEATLLAVTPNGSSLDVIRSGSAVSLMTVCLERCETCACALAK